MPQVVPSQVVQVIESYFPQIKNNPRADFTIDRGYRNECVSIAHLLKTTQSETLNPPSIDDFIELMSNIAVLDYTIDLWKTPYVGSAGNLIGKGRGNPISIIHDVLLLCPDEAISEDVSGLEFMDDVILRDSLLLDISSIKSALSNNEWKATTVLAGSTVEALLLWAVQKLIPTRQDDIDNAIKKHKIKESDLNKWDLNRYNKIAKELSIIKERTYNQVDLAREFRNYIHPGREIRELAKCSKATAYSGIAAVEFVIEDLAENFE